MIPNKDNLVDKEFEEIAKQFSKGNIPKGLKINRVYKHPSKNRTILKSLKQIRGTRRG